MIWHYTTCVHLAEILQAGFIRATPLKPDPLELAGVWFTNSPDWEPTCAKNVAVRSKATGTVVPMGLTTREELISLMGLARIGVVPDEEFLSWNQFAARSPEQAARLAASAHQMAKEIGEVRRPQWWVEEWWIKLGIVASFRWLKIEEWRWGKWR